MDINIQYISDCKINLMTKNEEVSNVTSHGSTLRAHFLY